MPRLALPVAALALLVPAAAAAQPPDASYEDSGRYGESIGGDVRSYTRDWLVGPPGWDVGGELRLITSDVGLGRGAGAQAHRRRARPRPRPLHRRAPRRAVRRRSTRWPSSRRTATAGPLQRASLGLKVAVSPTWALATATSGGPTLADDGLWGGAATAMVFRAHPDETLSFQVSGGADATALRFSDAPDQWLTEATAGGTVMFHTPRGEWGTWLGASFAAPVVASDALDPSARLDVTIGSVYALAPAWDVYAEGSIVDRGDADMPATMLPILDGGFDQRQLTVGVVYRMERGDRRSAPLALARR
jgi:hypothetical protein